MGLIRPRDELALGYGPRGARQFNTPVKSNSCRGSRRQRGAIGSFRASNCVNRVSSFNVTALTHNAPAYVNEGLCLLVQL